MEMNDVDTADIDTQIAALVAAKQARLVKAANVARARELEEARVLVGSTPTKRKSIFSERDELLPPSKPLFNLGSSTRQAAPAGPLHAPPPAPSSMSTVLAQRRAERKRVQELPSIPQRSISFTAHPPERVGPSKVNANGQTGQNDDDELEVERTGAEREGAGLTLMEDLRMGPSEFGLDPEGEEVWRSVEPNSGIRLSKRVLPHSHLQEHLYGRYYVRPSQLYSIIRLSRDGTTCDVPIEGDWMTIAVVAERSDIRVSGTKASASDDEDEFEEDGEIVPNKGSKSSKNNSSSDKWKKRGPKKYINLKLCSLPPRTNTLGKAPAGDTLLQLLLFEADSIVRKNTNLQEKDDNPDMPAKSYRGGSGGAYEKWCNLAVGSVVAILNPRVLRPMKIGAGAPHPLTLPLALNPTSAETITLIGHSLDLGCCTAMQKDGTRCKTWVDSRVGPVCEYHVHAAVKRGRTSRAEFASATTSFALSTRGVTRRDNVEFDPRRKTGLLPRNGAKAAPRGSDNGGGGATYVVGSGIALTGPTGLNRGAAVRGFGEEYLGEKLGRSRAEKRRRQLEEAEADAALTRMFERNGGDASTGGKYLSALRKKVSTPTTTECEDRKRPFSAAAIQRIGFDPTARTGRDEDATRRLESIASLKEATGKPLKLGRAPGPRQLSSVVVPTNRGVIVGDGDDDDGMIDLD